MQADELGARLLNSLEEVLTRASRAPDPAPEGAKLEEGGSNHPDFV